MGDFRCTFRNCENSTQNNPAMHFFRFPSRDLPRCEKWAVYSNNLAFLQLPISQLRDKIVCDTHFKEPCFMNIKHNRLTKFAIPTLLRTKNGEVVDLEIDQSNPTIYDVQKTTTIEYAETDQCQEEDINDTVDGITPTKIDINRFKPVCTDTASLYTKLKRKVTPTTVKSKLRNDHVAIRDSLVNDNDIEYFDFAPKRSKVAEIIPSDISIVRQTPDKAVDRAFFLDKQKKEIDDLKKIIASKMEKLEGSLNHQQSAAPIAVNAQDRPPRNAIEAGPMRTKIQLFNGIKKYLNPSMVALLRMEMFGDTERQYKSDEKSLAVELLNVQSNIYEYMISELRFRLPPKKDAESWAKEMSENGREIDWEDEF